jgi:hypothetical protein
VTVRDEGVASNRIKSLQTKDIEEMTDAELDVLIDYHELQDPEAAEEKRKEWEAFKNWYTRQK